MLQKYSLLAFSFCLLLSFSANTQLIVNETQTFSFGEFAMTDLSTAISITIAQNGNVSTTGSVDMLVDGTKGLYTISNGPTKTSFTISTPASITLTGPGPGTFTIDSFGSRPNSPRFNNSGIEDIEIYGRLVSQGGGVSYSDGVYSGTLNITLNY